MPNDFTFIRAEDLLVLEFQLGNLEVRGPSNARTLAQIDPGQDSTLVVLFPAQHLAEVASSAAVSSRGVPSPALSRAAEKTRLAFRIPKGAKLQGPNDSLLDALLAWAPMIPQIAANGQPAGDQTGIELPYRLVLSPDPSKKWLHKSAKEPIASNDLLWYPLWHTRLGGTTDGSRAIQAAFARAGAAPAFDTVPTDAERSQIATQSSGTSGAIDVDPLVLSSLGAWLNAHGEWPSPLAIATWREVIALGRTDHAVVVSRGHLYPFGHKAVAIDLVQRMINADGAACLHRQNFVIVREFVKTFDRKQYANGIAPFAKLEIVTRKTDPLDVIPQQTPFWPSVGQVPFPFHLRADGFDDSDVGIDIFMPLMFVPTQTSYAAVRAMADQRSALLAPALTPRRVALANKANTPSAPSLAFEARKLTFDSEPMPLGDDVPAFTPKLTKADIVIPALRDVLSASPVATVALQDPSLAHSVFAVIQGDLAVPTLGPQLLGGMADNLPLKPNGLSTILGAIPHADAFSNAPQLGAGELQALLSGIKLFGCVPLSTIVAAVNIDASSPSTSQIPKLSTLNGVSEFRWTPPITPTAAGAILRCTAATTLAIIATAQVAPPGMRIEGHFTNFDLSVPVLIVHFDSLDFISCPGQKPSVTPHIGAITPQGALAFVGSLLQGLASTSLGGIHVNFDGGVIRAGIDIHIPAIGVGVFALQNIAIDVDFDIPFGAGELAMTIAFGGRERPIQLSVMGLGGGAFLAFTLAPISQPRGIRRVEGALEFGAMVALSLGVASGEAHIMGGIYFIFDSRDGITITGYLRCGGSLDVLGLITASVEFYMGLTFHNGVVSGKATLVIGIRILFFHTEVTLSIERTFAGSGAHAMQALATPSNASFGDALTPDDWDQYRFAFA